VLLGLHGAENARPARQRTAPLDRVCSAWHRVHQKDSRMQNPVHRSWDCRNPPYDPDEPGPRGPATAMETARRENYDSGEHFVLEYGELRFTFNERDFTERVEQAAIKLGFVRGTLGSEEREDIVNLAVNGEIIDAHSELGHHVNSCWGDLAGPSDRSLVHWLRRLVFRGAWLDQRVKEGELDICFDGDTRTFSYIQPDRGGEPIELAPEPSWNRVAYVASGS